MSEVVQAYFAFRWLGIPPSSAWVMAANKEGASIGVKNPYRPQQPKPITVI